MVAKPPPWDRDLEFRLGSERRLAGIDVFTDFDWLETFGHDRRQFPGGQSLAELIKRDCPGGKCATLLLTDEDGAVPGILETDERYTAVVPIHDYLNDSGADTASTYYAHLSATPLTRLATLAEVDFSREQLDDFLVKNLTLEVLTSWATQNPEHMDVLREVSGASEPALRAASPEDVIAVLRGLSVLDQDVVDAVINYLGRFPGDAGVRGLLQRLTESEDGRASAANVLAERLVDRISDTRRRLDEYGELISSPGVSEGDVQEFLEASPWIVGLPYVAARPRVQIPRGEIDFVLDRFDGFFDIVELKGPGDRVIAEPRDSEVERPPSASSYSLGKGLANALAQAHHYRSILEGSRDLVRQYGLGDPREPRILILLGRSTDLSETAEEILRQLNLTLHRVEVIPYDVLGERTEGLLANIEELARDTRAPSARIERTARSAAGIRKK